MTSNKAYLELDEHGAMLLAACIALFCVAFHDAKRFCAALDSWKGNETPGAGLGIAAQLAVVLGKDSQSCNNNLQTLAETAKQVVRQFPEGLLSGRLAEIVENALPPNPPQQEPPDADPDADL